MKRSQEKQKADTKFRLHDFGWNRRLKIGMKTFLSNATRDDFVKIGFKDQKKLDLIVGKEEYPDRSLFG